MNIKKFTAYILVTGLFVSAPLLAHANQNKELAKDSLITSAVATKLASEGKLVSKDILTNTHQSEVQLCGFVEDVDQERIAVKIAQSTKGVKKVIDSLTPVNSLEVSNASSIGEAIDDATITANVKKALIVSDPNLAAAVHVVTHHGYVQLCGFTEGDYANKLAANLAKGTEGVKGVKNTLLIKK